MLVLALIGPIALFPLIALSGCAAPEPPPAVTATPAPTAEVVVTAPLGAPALLRRLSLDLRGTVPTLDELASVEADPAALAGLREDMLADPRFEVRFADLLGEQYLTRIDSFNIGTADYHLDADRGFDLARAAGSEPLVFLAAVAAQDLPWTDAVRADWTMANDLLVSIWPLARIDGPVSGAAGWYPARYTDDRPAGGVVMTNGLWWRYWSAPNNYNRTRAAALSRLLLCEDFLQRPVSFQASSLLDAASLNEATRTETACVGCHATLDPLAAAFFGFWWFDIYDPAEMSSYHAEREYLGETYLEMGPAWFGTPLASPAELGGFIGDDPRFARCTVERIARGYWRRPVEDGDFTTINALEAAFSDGGLRMKALVRAVLDTPEYQAGALLDAADADAEDRVATRRVMSPSQLEQAVEDLTGYRWTREGYDQLENDLIGYRVLGGGVDGVSVTAPEEDPTLSRALVVQRLAQAAASAVVADDFAAAPADRRLLTEVELDTEPGDPAFDAQLTDLHRRLFATSPTAENLAAEGALWADVATVSGPAQAWTSLVSVLLRDPAFWSY